MNVLRIVRPCSSSRRAACQVLFLVSSKTPNGPKSSHSILLERTARLRVQELSRHFFASKKSESIKLELPQEGVAEKKEPKYRGKTEDYKQKVYLKDISGRMLGMKTRQEAQLIATKNRLILVADDATKKIPTLKLADPRKVPDASSETSSDDSESSSSSSDSDDKLKPNRQPPKHLVFTSKLNDHDLQVKIRHIKKWVSKGQETIVKVTIAGGGDSKKLESIDRELDCVFNQPAKFGTKINQRRLTDKDLKLNVVPVDLELITRCLEADDALNDSNSSPSLPNLDQLDPNQLLNDENVLQKIDDAKKEN